MIKRLFLAANTAYGFKSFFDDRLKPLNKIYILKGGPGTGKSTLLRKVALKAEEEGLSIELWHCSGDVKSLDGVYIKGKEIAIVDGTAPHVVEASLPGTRDRLISLGDFINESKVLPHSQKIATLCSEKATHYVKAYRRLKIANEMLEEIESNYIVINSKLTQLCSSVAYNVRKATKVTRQLNKAISPQGRICFFDHIADKQIIALRAESSSLVEMFFDKISHMLCGFDAYMSPLGRGIDNMVVGRYAIVKEEDVKEYQELVDLNLALRKSVDKSFFAAEKLEFDRNIGLAISELGKAREKHLEIEKYYIDAMDFEKVAVATEKLIEEIFS